MSTFPKNFTARVLRFPVYWSCFYFGKADFIMRLCANVKAILVKIFSKYFPGNDNGFCENDYYLPDVSTISRFSKKQTYIDDTIDNNKH